MSPPDTQLLRESWGTTVSHAADTGPQPARAWRAQPRAASRGVAQPDQSAGRPQISKNRGYMELREGNAHTEGRAQPWASGADEQPSPTQLSVHLQHHCAARRPREGPHGTPNQRAACGK